VNISTFARLADTSASPNAITLDDIVRAETMVEADDGQQFQVMLLDADDTFDVVITYPNGQREVVWSLVREREHPT
jgi:hypothetical protein